ncbi:MAG TPA: OmpA family protein [Spirochaetota bacterium]|nr:OmpA family protein [Spirochaetota bacterium]
MKKDNIGIESFEIIKRINQIENPVLRHFIKKFNLDSKETLLLGVLIDITNLMKTELKTEYSFLSAETGLQKMDIYHGLNSLHRCGIIQFKSDRKNLLHVSFNELTEDIEEISLAYKNAEKIKLLRRDVEMLKRSGFIPRDELFEAIYPMTGEIISRKISEAFMNLVNYLNEKLEQVTSARSFGYRIKSFFTGIPVSELLLADSLPFIVTEIFMLQKDSGILLVHASRSQDDNIDRDMVGGMLVAINEFAKTAFDGNANKELDEIKYGRRRIIIRSAETFLMAFVVSGAPSFEFMNSTGSLTAETRVKYGKKMKKFTGDVSLFAAAGPRFEEFMASYNTPHEDVKAVSYRKLKVISAILLILSAAWLCRSAWSFYIDSRHEKAAMQRIRESAQPNMSDVSVEYDGGTATVRGYASDFTTIKSISAILEGLEFTKSVDNRVLIVDFAALREYSGRIENLNTRINSLETETVRRSLETIKIEFAMNSTDLNSTAENNLDGAVSILKNFSAIKITLAAFSDYNGSVGINQDLAVARMNSISVYLSSKGISRDRIRYIDFDPDFVKNDPRVIASPASRGIVIYASTGE